MKDLLLMSLRQKADKIDWEELGSNATFLPLIYLVVMAPGFLILIGISCLLAAALGGPSIDKGLLVKLGLVLVATSFTLIFTYRMVIKYQFKMKKKATPEVPIELPKTTVESFIAPFKTQIQHEQKLFLGKID